MSKLDKVLEHLINHGSITQMEAYELCNATRLADIIFKLKKKGFNIEKVTEKGNGCTYARYYLGKAGSNG